MSDNLTNSKRKYFWLGSLVGWVVTVESRFNFVTRLPLTSGSKIDNNNVNNNYDQFSSNMETSPVVYQTNQIAGFYMMRTLVCQQINPKVTKTSSCVFQVLLHSFITHLFARGEAVPGSQLLMNDMPTRLQQEVTYEEMSEIIMKVLSL